MDEEVLTLEEIKILRKFKASLFDLYWEQFGFFYIHVLPHTELQMGGRGLVGKEKDSGVVLAFGPTACRELSSEENYLYAELQFGMKWEKLYIPWDSVFRIFDKAQNSLVQLRFIKDSPVTTEKSDKKETKIDPDSNVIQIDFSKKK